MQPRLLATRFYLGVYFVNQKKGQLNELTFFASCFERAEREIDEPIVEAIVWWLSGVIVT